LKTIFFQLVLLQVVSALITASVLWTLSERSFTESLSNGFMTNGQTIAATVARSVELPMANRDIGAIQAALVGCLKVPDVEWAYVTSPDGQDLADTFAKFPDYLKHLGPNKPVREIRVPNTNKSVIIFSQDGIFGGVHIGLSKEGLLAAISKAKLLVFITLISVIFALTAIVALLTRRTIAPIRLLTKATLAMAEDPTGEFQPLTISSRNEIGTLTASFNRMNLERQEYRKHLEARVAERTQDLVQANRNLDSAKTRAEEANAALQHANEELHDQAAERKLLEGQLVQAQKLESIGQLAAGIAHEVNTPIQYIGDNCLFLKTSFADFTSLLEQHVELLNLAKATGLNRELVTRLETTQAAMDVEFLVQEIPKAIDQTLEGVERVSQIVIAMKEFSHPGSGEKALADLNHAIVNTLFICHNEVKHFASIVTDLDHSLPPVCCLIGEMNQVVLNLVVNAAHAMEGKRVDGEKGTIRISTRLDGAFVEIRVQDDGTGIPEAIRNKIFDPFFTTKEVGKGTGQGLAIVRNTVVKKHGGTLTFETAENVGTTFIVRIPIQAG